jgi:hypothetical protein
VPGVLGREEEGGLMARKRWIHPDTWHDERVVDSPWPERLLFLGMISLQDDEQRLSADPMVLRAAVFPKDGLSDELVEYWRDELCRRNPNIVLYAVGRSDYVWLAKASPRYQKPDHPTPSRLPRPEDGIREGPGELLAKWTPSSRERLASESVKAMRRIGERLARGSANDSRTTRARVG